ncbi:hypothetical protein [Proteus terrae]|uniref:hypothetical protein n=1 Tax=Proteus terrae TaxID=1574161 RepID=UPI0021A653F0|nr:hypothetical protein [Proteus terrae]
MLDKLSSQYPNIILIGGSEGATMVHLVVAKRNDIKAAIALNGGGVFFLMMFFIISVLPHRKNTLKMR